MPRILRLRNNLIISAKRPSETSPATSAIKNHRNETYLVFMDETFRAFFGLERPQGYLCYAAVGIPEKEYEYVKRSLARVFKEFESYVVGDFGNHLKEFKFEELKRLPRSQKESIASQIGRIIKLADGFIMGFYARVAGIVMERVRTNLVGEAAFVPNDHKDLYDEAAAELRIELAGVGQSQTIAHILRIPLSALTHFLESPNCKFRLLCDPRESKEDRAVQLAIDDYIGNHFGRALPKEAGLYLGLDNTRPSHTEIGLQLADILAGEVRSLFEAHPGLVTGNSSLDLVGSSSREDVEWWDSSLGFHQKLGHLTKMPDDLFRAVSRADGTNCLPLYRHSLAAGLLTCFTDLGQPRQIEVFEGNFFQQLD
jgi:hypothetical protein